jgi:hypothetical protein
MPRSYYYVSTKPVHRAPTKVAAYRVDPGEGNVVARITFIGHAERHYPQGSPQLDAIAHSERLVGSPRPTKRGCFQRIAVEAEGLLSNVP